MPYLPLYPCYQQLNALTEEGKLEEYLKLVSDITLKSEIANKFRSEDKEEPYIKPSDML